MVRYILQKYSRSDQNEKKNSNKNRQRSRKAIKQVKNKREAPTKSLVDPMHRMKRQNWGGKKPFIKNSQQEVLFLAKQLLTCCEGMVSIKKTQWSLLCIKNQVWSPQYTWSPFNSDKLNLNWHPQSQAIGSSVVLFQSGKQLKRTSIPLHTNHTWST